MSLNWPAKDPDEVLDYQIVWTARLDGDTIATSAWQVGGSGLVIDSDANTTTTTTVWLSAGVLGTKYHIVNRVITAGGRTMEEGVTLRVRAR